MKVLIFGGSGFVGKHLTNLLEPTSRVYNFDLAFGDDIRDYEKVRTVIDAVQPDRIYHLAAMAFVSESNQNPQRAIDTHIKGTVNILEAVRQLGLRPKILLASTSEEYGYDNQTERITEESPIRPNTIYGATKAAMTTIAGVYRQTYGMHIVVTRAFNHIGTGKGEQYADTSFAKRIVQIERGELDVLKHGNLDSVRNYTDVRDIVEAYRRAIECEPGVYNVCSQNNLQIRELLNILISNAKADIPTEEDSHLFHPSKAVFHPPSAEKLYKLTGWTPVYAIEDSAKALLNDWRERLDD